MDLRRVPLRRNHQLTWPEQLILEFFLPGTAVKKKKVDLQTGELPKLDAK